MKTIQVILLMLCIITYTACSEHYNLLSDDIAEIAKACEYYGNKKDTSAVKLLLRKSLDWRVQSNILDKGFSVNHSRLNALKKISGVKFYREFRNSPPDTAATLFYVDWAIKNGFVKDLADADINYSK